LIRTTLQSTVTIRAHRVSREKVTATKARQLLCVLQKIYVLLSDN